jgi:hypothetical protein
MPSVMARRPRGSNSSTTRARQPRARRVSRARPAHAAEPQSETAEDRELEGSRVVVLVDVGAGRGVGVEALRVAEDVLMSGEVLVAAVEGLEETRAEDGQEDAAPGAPASRGERRRDGEHGGVGRESPGELEGGGGVERQREPRGRRRTRDGVVRAHRRGRKDPRHEPRQRHGLQDAEPQHEEDRRRPSPPGQGREGRLARGEHDPGDDRRPRDEREARGLLHGAEGKGREKQQDRRRTSPLAPRAAPAAFRSRASRARHGGDGRRLRHGDCSSARGRGGGGRSPCWRRASPLGRSG